MKSTAVALAILMAALPPAIAQATGGSLSIEVTGIRFSGGSIRVDVCTSETFLKATCEYSASAIAVEGSTTVQFEALPPGVYAAQVYHDWNDNHHVDRNSLGIPKEGLGFSNDAPLGLHGPRFPKAAFTHDSSPQVLTVKLHHFSPIPKTFEK